MQTTLELPEPLFRRTEEIARSRGLSVDALISDVLEHEFGKERSMPAQNQSRLELPLLVSSAPGTLDLKDFDFDDLLA